MSVGGRSTEEHGFRALRKMHFLNLRVKKCLIKALFIHFKIGKYKHLLVPVIRLSSLCELRIFSLSALDVADVERETLRQHVKIVAIDLCAACHREREACNKLGAQRAD